MTGIGARASPLLALGLLLLAPGPLGAQQHCAPPLASLAKNWTPPLDRPVSLIATNLSLRDALDRLAAAARLRLSYSSENLPLDREACVEATGIPLGAVLEGLLAGSAVEAVPVSADVVVLAPVRRPDPEPRGESARAVPLETIVVTGSAAGSTRRPLPYALDVVSGEELRAFNTTALAAALDGAVPGLWIWSQPPTSLLTSYASVRGASSFGLSYPKVYIDGIEVANPLILTGLEPDAIERIEVIRGPQGAALYGADAISGVMNIVTRQAAADPDAARVSVESRVGVAATDYETGTVVDQRHALAVRVGSNLRAASLHASLGSVGEFTPGASSTRVSLQGGARAVGTRTIWTGLARLATDESRAAASPLLPDSLLRPALRGVKRQSVLGYTIGSTLKLIPSERWTHTVMVGLDGYTLDGVIDDRAPIISAADSALRAAEGGAVRASVRVGSLRRFGIGSRTPADLALSVEHSTLHQWSASDSAAAGSTAPAWRHTTGASLLGNLELAGKAFLSAGARVEGTTDNDPEFVPMVGATLVQRAGDLTLKLRGSWGRGVRWPLTPARRTLFGEGGPGPVLLPASLEPEVQSGVEMGIDVLLGDVISAGATRFDQTASGLIQRVAIALDSAGGPPRRRIAYQYQNVGEIGNSGWEFTATVGQRGFSLVGTLSLVDSRVEKVAQRYRGDLQAGDRMLEVPARTMGLSVRWRDARWSLAAGASRAEDWIDYDRLALASAFAGGGAGVRFAGAELRQYWRTYPGVTRLRASASRSLGRSLRVTLSGENLLNEQTGEPDNLTVLPGRTLSLGVWAGL
ncbi:MAG TPA: TonB-dependent receptor [Gemmatimonadales bacterium]|nr:TonB-dependent receptor [Gemmatimonadales bacterium]